jgi:hypothetical protein
MPQASTSCRFGATSRACRNRGATARIRAAFIVALATLSVHAAGTETGSFTVVVKPGGVDERCLRLRAGQSVDYRFAADAALDFNIHHHRGREVFYPVRQAQVRAAGPARFVAPADDDYCLMWENRGSAPVRLEGRLEHAG